MNFYQHQDQARRKSRSLVILLLLAVTTLIVLTALIIAVFLYFFQTHTTSIDAASAHSLSFSHHLITVLFSPLMLWVSLGVVLVVLCGSGLKARELRQGGAFVAASLGGKLLLHDNANADEQRLLNVVEEMAIASGSSIPLVFVLEEQGINAFAAGSTPNDTVIGVTRGCIETLNREQLQGVIAHEFSHIYHGDMRLNMRLLAVLHGILVIGLIGQFILESTGYRRMGRHHGQRREGNQIALLGIALVALGFGGTFFGKLIKSAVSRQREFLADASAVQFTRSPTGIAGALLKIRQHSAGSEIEARQAEQFSHFYFANGVQGFLSGLFATHPPLDNRIERVYPAGIGALEHELSQQPSRTQEAPAQPVSPPPAPHGESLSTAPNPISVGDALIMAAGTVSLPALGEAHTLLASLPHALLDACHTPYQARAVIYALLLDTRDQTIRSKQIEHLKQRAHPATYREFAKLEASVSALGARQKLPLVQLCLPALQTLSSSQAKLFRSNVKTLIEIDRKVSVFEWSLTQVLQSAMRKQESHRVRSLKELDDHVRTLLSFLAKLSGASHSDAAFRSAMDTLWPEHENSIDHNASLASTNTALRALQSLKPLDKPKLLKAMLRSVMQDGEVSLEEEWVLRAVAMTLDCPIPLKL